MRVGFLSLLAVVFITLKLCAVIDWSWWLVLLPLYGPTVLVLAFFGTCAIIGTVLGLCGVRFK